MPFPLALDSLNTQFQSQSRREGGSRQVGDLANETFTGAHMVIFVLCLFNALCFRAKKVVGEAFTTVQDRVPEPTCPTPASLLKVKVAPELKRSKKIIQPSKTQPRVLSYRANHFTQILSRPLNLKKKKKSRRSGEAWGMGSLFQVQRLACKYLSIRCGNARQLWLSIVNNPAMHWKAPTISKA